MAETYSIQRTTSDGTLELLVIAISYFDRADISVFFDDVVDAYDWEWVGATDKIITFPGGPIPEGVEVQVRRNTKLDEAYHVFKKGALFRELSMDENFEQILFLVQEAKEGAYRHLQ